MTKRVEPSRTLFYGVVSCGLLGLAFGIGLHAGAQQTAIYEWTMGTLAAVHAALDLSRDEASTVLRLIPKHFLQPARHEGSGVTVNDPSGRSDDLILLSGFFVDTNEVRLVRRSGEVVARWPVKYYTLFAGDSPFPSGYAPATDWNVDLHGALALPDGSVVFNFEWGGLVKLDRCGHVVWKVPRRTHHSVERAEGGGFWVPARRTVRGPSPFPPFETPFEEDTILRISDHGRVESEVSVPRIFYDHGLEALLMVEGVYFWPEWKPWNREILHLNKVVELPTRLGTDFPGFEPGDLALSIRDLNLVMIVDPAGGRIKWWRIGPWLRQHDPEFAPGGTIVLFNNNIHEHLYGVTNDTTPASTPQKSNILDVNPASGATRILFGGSPGEPLLSVFRGKVDLTPTGGFLITEQDGGRVIEVDADRRVVWEYVNRYSPTEVAEITEARLYPASYFTVTDWSCSLPLR
jgi:hypothetical protein